MSFLELYVQNRATIGNFEIIDVDNETVKQETNAGDENNVMFDAEVERAAKAVSPVHMSTSPPKKRLVSLNSRQQPKTKAEESASAILMKYLIDKQKQEETSHSAAEDPIDLFFKGMAAKVKKIHTT